MLNGVITNKIYKIEDTIYTPISKKYKSLHLHNSYTRSYNKFTLKENPLSTRKFPIASCKLYTKVHEAYPQGRQFIGITTFPRSYMNLISTQPWN